MLHSHNSHNTNIDQLHLAIPNHHHEVDQQDENHVEEVPDHLQEKMSESQDVIINVCSDVCSNPDSSSNENSQISSIGDEFNINNYSNRTKQKNVAQKKKKIGGKIKGTLETSLEMRNRMIGMSEAGLSTLSIALSINRSVISNSDILLYNCIFLKLKRNLSSIQERTVKRWLDRWRKEGNVQTKERKGRKRITTKEQDDAIIAMATEQPLTAAKYVAPALGLKCSVDTVRERLHKAGIHSWKLGKKQG